MNATSGQKIKKELMQRGYCIREEWVNKANTYSYMYLPFADI